MCTHMPYYCIAMTFELWFERLDFDAFQRTGPVLPKCMPRPFARGGGHASFFARRRNARGFYSRERERHEGVEEPNEPSFFGMGGGRGDGIGQRDGTCRTGSARAVGVQATGVGFSSDGQHHLVS